MRTAFLIMCLLAFFGSASADDTYVERVGGTAKMIKGHPTIRMVREHVRIEPNSGKVVATFVFRNEGPKQTVLMGFPETDYKGAKPYQQFWSTVDGRPIGVVPIQGSFSDETKGRYWTKRVPFDRGQTREVMVGYVGGKGEVSDGQRFMCYILDTGAAWKGPIGQVRIDCDLRKLKYADKIAFSIEPDRLSKTKATWVIRNWEPDGNWRISWYPGFRNFQSNDSERISRMYRSNNFALQASCPTRVIGNEVWGAARCVAPMVDAGILKAKNGFMLKSRKHEVRFTIGSRLALADGRPVKLSQPVFSENGYSLIPFGQTLKLFGIDGFYSKKTRAFRIDFPKEQQ